MLTLPWRLSSGRLRARLAATVILVAAVALTIPALWFVYGERVGLGIFASTITLTVPLLWASLGEAVSQKAGVLNIGVEGVILFGAFAAALGSHLTGSLVIGLGAAIVAGLLCALVLGFLYLVRDVDQVVGGIQFGLLALGLTTVLDTPFLTGSAGGSEILNRVPLPLLSSIPVLGPTVFSQTVLAYLAFLMAPVTFYILRHSWFGLCVRAVGERPGAADAAGVDVLRVRWIAVGFECVMVAVGGAALVLAVTGDFTPGMSGGRGFIAIAVVMLASWNPIVVIGCAAMFGLATALEFQLQVLPVVQDVPKEIWLSLPYLVTLVVIALVRGADFPNALGIPFERLGRRL